jgi:hypothetical protein
MAGRIEAASFLIAALVEGEDHLCGEFAAFFQHGVDGVGIQLGVGRQGFELPGHVEHFVQHELHVP